MSGRPRIVGVNHVALEVGDLEAALAFYGRLFGFELRARVPGMAFLDMGDQFLALSERRRQPPDDDRHFGLVVEDKETVRRALEEEGVEVLPGRRLDFRDPWGNRVEIVDYRDVQFTKAPEVLRGMGLEGLGKSAGALQELRRKGLAGEDASARRG
jgi:catechol-2,3-dioxygenase